MRKNTAKFIAILMALFALIATVAAQDTEATTCAAPAVTPVVGQMYRNSTNGTIRTRIGPSLNSPENQLPNLDLGGTIIVTAVEIQPNCDVWVKSMFGWTAVVFDGVQMMEHTDVAVATAQSFVNPTLTGVVTGPIYLDGIPVGQVVVPQVENFELLVPEGGISFVAATRLENRNEWDAFSEIGANFVDDDVDQGHVVEFEIDRNARTIAVVLFHNEQNNADLTAAFVSELFALGATSVNMNGTDYASAPAAIFEFNFAPEAISAQSSTAIFDDPAALPAGVSAWGIGWHYALQRDPEVVEPSGYTNWIALNAATLTINGWSKRFESGEQGESLIFIRQTPVGVQVSDRAAGAGSFNALALETEDGVEPLEFTMANVAANSFMFNCGDGCETVTLSYVDPSNLENVTVEQLIVVKPEITFAEGTTPEAMKEAYFNAILPQVQTFLREMASE